MLTAATLSTISSLLFLTLPSTAQQHGPQSGETFTVEGMSFGPLPNISYPISPLLDSSTTTVFNTSDAYSQSEEGIRASVPIDSKMYEAILEGIENFGGDWEIDDSAKNVYTPGNSIIPVNCSDACGIVEWHPHFTTWFGKFEGSGVEGSLSMPNEEERGDVLVRCMAC